MIRVLGNTHFTKDLGAILYSSFANHFKDFWLDLILQFGIRAWYSNLGFNNLQIHHKNLIFV
ncbi:hypothetical protein HanRHA438_Chr17g0834081 [Helianthus annuus]|nr:hypothetical protein HanIR_Chr17g0894701 [Helianthus annuus]KAJ0828165.1 hypothetical protein HanRHA438_Chr17g0834081 [Helianthus annuus]